MSDSSSPSLPSLPGRIVAVFVSPGRLFEQLRDRPVWGTTMLLLVILNVIMMFLLPAELFEEQIRRSMGDSGMGEDEIALAATVGRYAGIAMAGVMGAVGSFVIAAVLFFVFSTLRRRPAPGAVPLGDNGRFRQYLSVVVHALVISSIGALVQVPLKRSAGDMELVLSLGTFAPFLEEGFVLSFLSAIGTLRHLVCDADGDRDHPYPAHSQLGRRVLARDGALLPLRAGDSGYHVHDLMTDEFSPPLPARLLSR